MEGFISLTFLKRKSRTDPVLSSSLFDEKSIDGRNLRVKGKRVHHMGARKILLSETQEFHFFRLSYGTSELGCQEKNDHNIWNQGDLVKWRSQRVGDRSCRDCNMRRQFVRRISVELYGLFVCSKLVLNLVRCRGLQTPDERDAPLRADLKSCWTFAIARERSVEGQVIGEKGR